MSIAIKREVFLPDETVKTAIAIPNDHDWKMLPPGTPVIREAGKFGEAIEYFQVAHPRHHRPSKRKVIDLRESGGLS